MTQPYKLKDEIRVFILERKKSDPIISCRKLVPLVWEHFQLKLSKSSVNAILKEHQLSSHVGRRRIRPRKTVLIKPLDLPKLIEPAIEKDGALVQPAVDNRLTNVPSVVSSEKSGIAAPAEPNIQPLVTPSVQPPVAVSQPDPVPVPRKKEIELVSTRRDIEYVVNCGCFLLRATDFKTLFTDSLASQIAAAIPELKRDVIYYGLEAFMYKQIFKSDNDLWRFLGSELDAGSFGRVCELISALDPIKYPELISGGLGSDNSLDMNYLSNGRLHELNSAVKETFFPSAYGALDFPTMFARFYCLTGRLERKGTLLAIRLFYPSNFAWAYDIVWQDDFQNAVTKVNQERIMTPEGEKIWFDPNIGFQK